MGEEAANDIVQAKPGDAPARKVELQVVFVPRGTTAHARPRSRGHQEKST
jgi:hypothetical protein